MQKMWFKAKQYGWGWYPATWQGWLVLAVYLAIVIGMAVLVFGPLAKTNGAPPANLPQMIALFVLVDVVATGALITICYKTGEKPTWRWGSKKDVVQK